jgi:alkylation response protein AidB-like acyl-CoA dehydrogenase
VNIALTHEQEMLRDAAADALSRLETVPAAREALDGAAPLDLWSTAREAGWTGLLIDDEHGGAGLRAFDAMLVLEQCGRRLAGAGLLGHLPATLVLARAAQAGDERATTILPSLAAGEARAAIAHARPPSADHGWMVEAIGMQARHADPARIAADGRLTGSAGFQPDLDGAEFLVVAALEEASGQPRAVLIEATAPGVGVEPILRYDATRPLAHVTLDSAPGHALAAGADELAEAWFLAQGLLAADALGVTEQMLELAVAYAKDRHAFGRPIGSFQAVKHQLVEILRHAGTTRSLCFYAGFAADARPAELPLAASAARFAGEEASDYATRTCIAIHGGIGATWEHDAHLYWRRAQLSRLLLGGVGDAGDRVAEEIIERARESAAISTT